METQKEYCSKRASAINMSMHRRLISISLFVVFLFSPALAQDNPVPMDNSRGPAPAPLVTATATAKRVRFVSPGTVIQLRLEVYNETGQKLFDTELHGGNVLDWHLQDGAGQPLQPGSYACVLTIKSLSGRLSQRVGLVTIDDKKAALEAVGAAQLSPAQQQTIGPLEGSAAFTVLQESEAEAMTAVAHDGSDGQLNRTRGALSFRVGDFFSGKDKEQMRLTEEGTLGIGTAEPKAKLDVAGMIRAREGFQFFEGSKLNVNDKGALTLTGADGNLVPNVAGTGTQNRLAKWTDNSGTLGDSLLSESGGNVVNNGASIQMTAAPSTLVDTNLIFVNGNDRTTGVIASSTPSFTAGNGPYFALRGNQYSAFAGQRGLFAISAGNVSSPTGREGSVIFNTGPDQIRMIVSSNGNVGVGTTSPGSLLDVAGNINTSTQYNIGGTRLLSVPGTNNLFAGVSAGQANTTGVSNSFFGREAGAANTTGSSNSFFGTFAGASNTTGSGNSFFGSLAGTDTTGDGNSFFGLNAGTFNTTGLFNSFVGKQAGFNNTTGTDNTFFGHFAGDSNTIENNNTFVGAGSNGVAGITNAAAIGFRASVTQSNSLVLGGINGVNGAPASVSVGIGTTAPQARLHVATGAFCLGPYCDAGNGRLIVGGPAGELTFLDRAATSFVNVPVAGERWVWYGIGGRARLWSNTDKLSVDPSGNLRVIGSVMPGTTPDIAETILADSSVTAADVVCADPEHRERAVRCSQNNRAILGVISDGTSGFLINSYSKSLDAPLTGMPLVLAGRVPVKVSLENGAIKIGDFLAPSSTPGMAMRANEPGPTIGIALEAFNGETEQARNGQRVGTVLCFVKAGEVNTSAALERLQQQNTLMKARNANTEARLAALETRVKRMTRTSRRQRRRK